LKSINAYFASHSVDIMYPFQFGSSQFNSQVSLEKLFTNFPNIAKLDASLFNCLYSNQTHQLKPMPRMIFLSIDDVVSKLKDAQLEGLFKKCPNLQRLSLTNYFRRHFNYDCLGSDLHELTLFKISVEAFREIVQAKGFQIFCLNLEPGNENINQFFLLIADYCPNLKELSIYSLDSKDEDIFLPKLRWIEKLDIFIPTLSIKNSKLTEAFQTLSNLRSISLCLRNYIPVQVILNLCYSYCCKIETIQINLSLKNPLTSDELEMWKKLKHLSEVNGHTFDYWKNLTAHEDT